MPRLIIVLFTVFPITFAFGDEGVLYRVNVEELKSYKEADISKMLAAKVVKHTDGDTVRVEFENPPPEIKKIESLRMIGVDTPETVHPKKKVEYFGKEASDFTKQRLLDKTVYIAFDYNIRDKYKRLLVYIYTASGKCHNADLIARGYGHAYTAFPFQFLDEFRLLEKKARTRRLGLWR
ncbi:MAG: thermonuclease family protein [Spirochaetaceae bacterium]|jgi:micrococcal nuclease|nr:thermonuclease family protein [Spirochaetaceae bacterium]